MFLAGSVLPGLLIPAVQSHLPQAVPAGAAQHHPPLPQQIRRHPDPVRHIIVCPNHIPAPSAQCLNKACRRGIHNDFLDFPPCRQMFQQFRILGVGFLPSLPAGVIVDLLHPVPHAVLLPPQPHGQRIHRPVVHGNPPPRKRRRRRRRRIPFRVEEVVDQPLCRRPFSQHEPPVENAGVEPLIPLPDLRCQSRIVLHGKMQPQGVPALRLFNPLLIEPVLRPLRIAVEPQPAAPDAASGRRLLHKGSGHQRRFVQQQPCQRAALNQCCAGSVFAAEKQKTVSMSGKRHRHHVGGAVFPHLHANPPQAGHQIRQQVPPQRPYGFPAQGKLPPAEFMLCPQEKRQSHAEGFPAPDGPVADNGLPAVFPPPGQYPPLLRRKPESLIPHPNPPPPGSDPSAPDTAGHFPVSPPYPAASRGIPAPGRDLPA